MKLMVRNKKKLAINQIKFFFTENPYPTIKVCDRE